MGPRNKSPHLSVIISVINKSATIQEIIKRVINSPEVNEIVILNDGSTDGTGHIRNRYKNIEKMTVINLRTNQGRGMAVRTALQNVKGDLIIIQDADLEYAPRDYPRMLQSIQKNNAEVVLGSRFLGEARRPIYFWNKVANKIPVFVTNIPYNNILTDMGTGCKLFNREVVTSLNLKSKGFGIEPELTARLLKRGVPIVEAPIRLNPHLYSEGKKIKAIGTFTALWTLVKYRLVD